ncbi:MAG: ABC transporter permease [Myxococcales bacterium]|nr:ABC transporter permease [Myxococcales bacterium]
MPVGNLTKMVLRNTVRSPRHFVLSAFGIVIGIASFVFFLGLSMGVRNVILGKIFPLEVVEVVAPRASFMGKDITKKLDDATVDLIRKRPEVKTALPRMALAFPAAGYGSFEGQELKFEVGGFCDGIDPSFLADDPRLGPLFKDWEAEEAGHHPACVPPKEGEQNPCADPEFYYCDEQDNACHRRVPVIVSPTLLELYNGQVASTHGLPVIGDLEQFVVQRGGLGRMRFNIGLGETMVAGSATTVNDKRRRVEGMLIGISPKAMPIGMTVPIQYTRRWNQEFSGDEAANTYSSIVVTLSDKDRLAVFSAWLQEQDLRLEDQLGERFATAIFIVTTLFVLISFTIVTISSINIAHNFFMQVSERRREIGVLRAVGATRTDVSLIILGEAALIGIMGGVIGVAIAYGGATMVDWASKTYLPRFPFKPPTYFDFQPWIIAGGLGFSTIFCVLGGFLPARKASRIAPAQALSQQ